jgi:hypothetical protein
MKMRIRSVNAAALVLTVLISVRTSPAGEIGWIEDFSLARDREVALKQLIPGTEDYYYYHALHYQNTEQWEKVDALLKTWVDRFQWTPRALEIQNRQALLTYNQNPNRTLEVIRNRLNLQFNHEREQLNQNPNLPTTLDPATLKPDTLTRQAFERFPNSLQGFEDAALDRLIVANLNPEQRRQLLSRLQRPDYTNLVELVIADLNYEQSAGFGQFEIHRRLLLNQLDQCLKLKPALRNEQNFVDVYLVRLHPSNDVNLRQDRAALEVYLDRLWSFVKTLSDAHNSLKAHVLYHRLVLDRQLGKYDQQRFIEYLKLPKQVSYVEPKYLEPIQRQQHPANLQKDYSATTLLPPIGDDEPLVRSYLMHFFVEAKDYKAFAPYIRDQYLKHVFAETKIVGGLGDSNQWYPLLSPELYQQLKDRIDLDFAFTNKTKFSADEPVSLDLYVKNVDTLIVKVFEINTRNFYQQNLKEVDTDINLDGLVPNESTSHSYKEAAVRRVLRHFEFPSLNRRGVYVIDFIGNGKASRALVRKGKLQLLVRTSVAGQVFNVLDESNQSVPQATAWFAGTLYKPTKDSEIFVPFTNQPGRQPVLLSDDNFSSLQFFEQEPEQYRLEADFYVDREELIARRTAQLLVRSQLWLGHTAVTKKVLEDVRLTITSTDLDGVVTTKEVPKFELHDDRESLYEFQVPQRLASIRFALTSKVEVRSQNKKVDLTTDRTFAINQIERTDKIEDLHFTRSDKDYVVDLLGKTGEAKADRPVIFSFKLRDYTQPVNVTLQTNPRGRVVLGPLAGVETVTATSPNGVSHTWPLRQDEHTYASSIQSVASEPIEVPYMGTQKKAEHSEVSLLELRGESFVTDRFENISIDSGLLKISKLPPGDYSLLLKQSGVQVRLRVTDGPLRKDYVLGKNRALELRNTRPLQLQTVTTTDKAVTLRLQNATPFARVHVFATRFAPAFSGYRNLAGDVAEPRRLQLFRPESQYVAGRNIGDEYRYIIDRKFAKKYPGNMLERPGILLNPWAIRGTETAQQVPEAGEAFAPADSSMESKESLGVVGRSAAQGQIDFANLAFLAEGSLVLANLEANKEGILEINRDDIGPHQELLFIAVDPQNTASRIVSLPEPKVDYLDLRLAKGLDPAKHFTQQKRITVLAAGESLVIPDVTSTRFEVYDTLARFYALYAALNNDAKLTEFGFLQTWPTLKLADKQELYKKYASHELHFFLAKKDPEFFKQAIRPYLANKRDKQFLDRWLVEQDLTSFVKSWDFEQLNTFERILLGQRINGEHDNITRLVREQFELLPPDADRFSRLFETALKGSALDVSSSSGNRFNFGVGVNSDAGLVGGRVVDESNFSSREAAPAPPAPSADPSNGTADYKKVAKPDSVRRLQLAQKGKLLSRASLLEHDSFTSDLDIAGTIPQYYQKLDKTKEWVESNYYQLPIDQQISSLIAVNSFWRDYAAHDPTKPFLPTSAAEATHNFPEMLTALALLDLPFEAAKHTTKLDGTKLTLTAGSPMIVYHEEIQPAEKVAEHTPILVSQNFFRHGDRYRQVGGEQTDKFVTEEFLVDVVYGCHIVVTNPTSSKKKINVLLQVPVGALPVQNGEYTRSIHLDLAPYHTQTLEYYFYFPIAGEFTHYPVQVASGGEVLAFAAPFEFNVVKELTNIDKESWDYVSQHGTEADVLEFLRSQNVLQVNLDRIAWRMKNKEFFKTVIGLLAARHIYNNTLWSYGIKHDDASAIRQFLQFAGDFVAQCGDWLDSPLLRIDPVVRKMYEHMEYRPLVNARVGQLGRKREILNDRFLAQYQRLLKILSYRSSLNADEQMALTYYLLLQDRVEEAVDFFGRVDTAKLATRLQHDYMTAYLAFYRSEPDAARQIAAKYADYPVESWREAFANVVNQADEIDKPDAKVADDKDRTQVQTAQAAASASFEFTIEDKRIKLNYQNLEEIQVNYYLMDIELLFSRNPFVQRDSKQFGNILPNASEIIQLPPKGTSHAFPIPQQLVNGNVLVEIVGSGITQSQAYYSNALKVQLVENYGQVRVTQGSDATPLSKVYVKVYARLDNGQVQFYKDGYTDLRGRFDYSSLSTNELDHVQVFSLLILSEDHGAVVREAKPPKR